MADSVKVRGLVHGLDRRQVGERRASVPAFNVRQTQRHLLRWGRQNFRSYKWRSESDPWLSFLAEFLLQRTRARQVEAIFEEVRRRFPTADALVRSGPEAVRELTERLGLHRRGLLLLDIAQSVASRGGAPPDSMEELCRLRGVGMYTAAAWLSLHRGKRAVIVEANVCRWLSRMTGAPYSRDPRNVRWIQELADDLTPRRVFRQYNYAVLDFTMTLCTSREPACETCPILRECDFGSRALAKKRSGK